MNGLSFPGTAKRRPLSANMGGPMSRTRKERVSSTLLGRDGGPIRCPRVIRLGLDFGGKAPVETLGRILAEEGYGSQEDLREDFPVLVDAEIHEVPLAGTVHGTLGGKPRWSICQPQ